MTNTSDIFKIRKILPLDNKIVANIIREVMTEFEVTGEKTSFWDKEVDYMFEAYDNEQSEFFVLTNNKKVIGCGGYGPLEGGDKKTCELRKMYFLPTARGKGLGKQLLKLCLENAKKLGYQKCYLETAGSMWQAQNLYKKMGFQKLEGPMGATGHGGCLDWYVKIL